MRKRALAAWPRKKEPIREAPAAELWVQEEEVRKLELQKTKESPREKLQQLLPGMDLKRLVL